MRKILVTIAAVAFLHFLSLDAHALPPNYAGPFTVNWTMVEQVTLGALVKSNETHTATSTDVSLLYKSTEKKNPAELRRVSCPARQLF